MDQGDVQKLTPKDALPPFAWPERFAPFAESYTGDGLRIETLEEFKYRIQMQKKRSAEIPDEAMFPPELRPRHFFDNEMRARNAGGRVLAFDGQNRVAALWYAQKTETGLIPKPREDKTLLKSPEGKTLRVEYVYDNDGRVIAKRIIRDSTPGAYDGEVYAIETYDYRDPDEMPNHDPFGLGIEHAGYAPSVGIGRMAYTFHKGQDTELKMGEYKIMDAGTVKRRGKIDALLLGDVAEQYGTNQEGFDKTLYRACFSDKTK